jgi:hypothetical protein
VLQQEMILKSVITRSGLDNPAIALARIVPTDHIDVPAQEPVIPIQDLVTQAIATRPEVEQNAIALENARLDLLGTKNNLLPTLALSANFSNAGQAGSITSVPQPYYNSAGQLLGYKQLTNSDVNSFLLGGYGTVLGQMFSRNFPNYNVGFTLTVPIRNRSNQADEITNELQYRQQQIQDKELHNNIKLSVMNNWTALRNSRAAYDTSVVARKLQDETLAGTRRKYELGTATILDVVIAQRDDTTRRLSEVDSLVQFQPGAVPGQDPGRLRCQPGRSQERRGGARARPDSGGAPATANGRQAVAAGQVGNRLPTCPTAFFGPGAGRSNLGPRRRFCNRSNRLPGTGRECHSC